MNHCCDAGKKVLHTLKIARGQLESTIAMVENDRYCVDIAKQILAITALLKSANYTVIRNHLDTCVTQAMQSEDLHERETKIEEIMLLLKSYLPKAD